MIRPAVDADADDVARLESDHLGADAWPVGLVAEGVRGRLPTVHYWVAELDGDLVGHAVASVVADIAELQRVSVEPALRRTGLATDLLDAVVHAARSEGADRVLLEVREDNGSARAFYAARGFAEIDRRARYYRDGAAAVIMMLGLSS